MPEANDDQVNQLKGQRLKALDYCESPPEPASTVRRRPIDIGRLAQRVADGQLPCPSNLDPAKQRALVLRVAQLRRFRLLRFIARAIANDIYQSRGHTKEFN